MKKVIVRLKGGIGNQLFQYAIARKLSHINNAELILDNISGFIKDYQYRRKYQLEIFQLPFKKIDPNWFWLYNIKRKFVKLASNTFLIKQSIYLQEESLSYDSKIMNINFEKKIYLDGFWQSYKYFDDISDIIKTDLKLNLFNNFSNPSLINQINNTKSVAIHFRFFSNNCENDNDNINYLYYEKAIKYIIHNIENPHFFVFSDNIEEVKKLPIFTKLNNITLVNNQGEDSAIMDLWLMSLCKNNIIANSTFSWWAAWLNNNNAKIIICPDYELNGKTTSWGFEGLIPSTWIKIY